MTFTTRRKLDTGDYEEDFLIPLRKEFDIIWAIRMSDADWIDHEFRDKATLTLRETHGNDVVLLP